MLGLLGGAPKAPDVDETRDVDKMNKVELMKYANDMLGVHTRRAGPDGKTNLYRAVSDVKHDCKAVQSRLCQASQENQTSEAHSEASPSSRQAFPRAQERAQCEKVGLFGRSPKALDVDKTMDLSLIHI